MTSETDLGELLSAHGRAILADLDVPPDLLSSVHVAHRRRRRHRIAGSALGVIAVLAGVSIGAIVVAQDSSDGQTVTPAGAVPYTNARFGFSDVIPEGFIANRPPEDGDGLSWHSPDGTATLTITGGNNTNSLDANADVTALRHHYDQLDAPGTEIISQGGGVVVVDGAVRGTAFYQRDLVRRQVIYTITWSYPASAETMYQRLVESTVRNFRPGPDHTA